MQDQIIKEISSQSRPLRIEVCGGIASGKTSIATLINRIGIKSIFENFKINPFWEAFYSDPINYAFETEITVYNEIKRELPAPVLLIHLNCDAKTELERIYKRGRIEEKKININFLKNLNRLIDRRITDASNEIRIISINSAQKNFVNDESVKQEVINLIIKSLPKLKE